MMFLLWQLAFRIEVKPAYPARIEQDEVPRPSEGTDRALATGLEMNVYALWAVPGTASDDCQQMILRPTS